MQEEARERQNFRGPTEVMVQPGAERKPNKQQREMSHSYSVWPGTCGWLPAEPETCKSPLLLYLESQT